MTHYFADYALFLAEIVTVILGIIILFASLLSLRQKAKATEKISIERLNIKFEEMAETLNTEILPKKDLKLFYKKLKKTNKEIEKNQLEHTRKRIFVLKFDGDLKASAVEHLREEITAILLIANIQDEVLLILESPGGMVHSYGLAASQLERIRQHKIPLTIAIDKVAASGGYLMACVANKIIAAPFAIIGSIGVLVQFPNFNHLLKKHNIEFEQITAGEYKRTVTMFGENTDKAREKMKEDVETIHIHFKDFIKTYREQVDIPKVATGEHWLAKDAQQLQLVDELQTSDDYLLNAHQNCDIFSVHYDIRKSLSDKIITKTSLILEKLSSRF